MKVILLENVHNLGVAGDVVDVKSGYGLNFLLPRKMAQTLTDKAVAEIEEVKRVAKKRADIELVKAKELAGKLGGHTVQITGKTGARGAKLYGSVTSQALASAISSYLNVEIDKRKISIPEPIKTLGLHKYNLKLHQDVEFEGSVEVVKKAETPA